MSWVAILMGSDSDRELMNGAERTLDDFGVRYETSVLSAHRKPVALSAYISDAETRGVGVYVCAAGLAAHLPGVVASQTSRPVVGVPVSAGALNGVDALLSIAQMPPGVPVACVAVDGARNAALLAVQILATADPVLAGKLDEHKQRLAGT